MSATELFKSGRLQEAIEAQIQDVKASPADRPKRLFLYELCCFAGDLDRARRQIEAVKYDDPDLDLAVLGYRQLIDAEVRRRQLFAEGLAPGFFGEPSEHLRLRVEAAGCIREGRTAEAADLLARADEVMPTIRGTLNEVAFESLRDADDLFSGVLEVMALGRYYWVGLEQVVSLTIKPPRFPRDLIFVPAQLELDSQAGEVFMPALYPGSHSHQDDNVKLGRTTEWAAAEDGPALGFGVHVYLRDDDDLSLLDWREFVAGTDEPSTS